MTRQSKPERVKRSCYLLREDADALDLISGAAGERPSRIMDEAVRREIKRRTCRTKPRRAKK